MQIGIPHSTHARLNAAANLSAGGSLNEARVAEAPAKENSLAHQTGINFAQILAGQDAALNHAQVVPAKSNQSATATAATPAVEPSADDAQAATDVAQDAPSEEFREAFDRFVGSTFYGQLIKSMRNSVGKPAYFHGGRAEEIFTAQLDQQMSEHLAAQTADQISGPMFELFTLPRP